jgi:hypothetical protein
MVSQVSCVLEVFAELQNASLDRKRSQFTCLLSLALQHGFVKKGHRLHNTLQTLSEMLLFARARIETPSCCIFSRAAS